MKKSILFFLGLCSLTLSTALFAHTGHGMDNNIAHGMIHSEWVVGIALLIVFALFLISKYVKNK